MLTSPRRALLLPTRVRSHHEEETRAKILTSPGNGDATVQALPDLSWFNSYHAFADHQQFIRDLQSNFPSNSELINAGNSYGGRSLLGIHLWGSGGKGSKPAIYWHGTVHAREWITTMV